MTELLLARRKSRKEEVPTIPGTPWQGGFYAGLIQVGADIYALVVAPKSLGESTGLAWRTNSDGTAGTSGQNDGVANTNAMIAAGAALHPAANFCNNLTIAGYGDWYLPARNELEILYRNFKPTTAANAAGDGIGTNNNSVPVGAAYTTSNPAQTPASLFKSGGAEAFPSSMNVVDNYWCSTSVSTTSSYYKRFYDGVQQSIGASSPSRVRAVRRVKVELPDPPASVGAPYEGGFYAGRIWHATGLSALVVAPKAGEIKLRWKTSQTTTAGTESYSDGWANTAAINSTSHPAAKYCRDYRGSGFDDWYLPAYYELEIEYRSLKPGVIANNTVHGANPDSLPPTGIYSAGSPAQTTATAFRAGGSQAFSESEYWGSNGSGEYYALGRLFSTGEGINRAKDSNFNVRPTRRVHQPIYVAKV